jgi:phosphoribosylpyrophosphate synthetase
MPALVSGTANATLAAAIAGELGVRACVGAATRFPDGEKEVKLKESVRGRRFFRCNRRLRLSTII